MTPTQREIIDRSKRFRAHIAMMAERIAPKTEPTVFYLTSSFQPEALKPFPKHPVIHIPKATSNAIRKIQEITASHFGIRREDMLIPGNKGRGSNKVCDAKRISMYLAREITGKSLPFIARCFNKADHTCVINAVMRMKMLLASDENARVHLQAIREKVKA